VDRVASELLEVETISHDRFVELMSSVGMNSGAAELPVYNNSTIA
jgi:hypothetical protein